jgi:hypothetical protein
MNSNPVRSSATQPSGWLARRQARGFRDSARAVDGEQYDRVLVALRGHGEIEVRAVAEREVLAHVHVVQPARLQQLRLAARQVVHEQALLLVRAEDAGAVRVRRVDPDGRVVGRVARARHGGRLRARQHDG